MSLQVPLSGVSSRYVSRLGHLPSSSELKHILVSGRIENVHTILASSFDIPDMESDTMLHKLNIYYQHQIDQLLSLLPENSAPFVYLQLHRDFDTLKQLTLNKTVYGEQLGEQAFSEILSVVSSKLHFATEFKKYLLKKEEKIIHSSDSFGIISYLEEIFLTLLFEHIAITSPVMKTFILAKIDSYTLLNVIARNHKGQSQEHIVRHLLPVQGSLAINAVKNFSFGDILGDIGQFLHLAPADINVINIENTLIRREIQALNTAQFTGMSADRIIQYTETLQYVIANLKLIILHQTKQIESEEAYIRFIDYSIL